MERLGHSTHDHECYSNVFGAIQTEFLMPCHGRAMCGHDTANIVMREEGVIMDVTTVT